MTPQGKVLSIFYDYDDGLERCPSCRQASFKLAYQPHHFGFEIKFYKCQCGLYKQVPLPNDKFFEWFFNSKLFFSSKRAGRDEIWGFYDYFIDEPSRYKTSRRRYRKLSKSLGWCEGLEIMKIGPSTGTFLHIAQQQGLEALGCDVSRDFVSYAWSNYRVRIDRGRFERMGYSDSRFDAILLFNVVENVPNLEELLSEIARTLKPGGHFILNHVEMYQNLLAWLQRDKYFIFRPPICYIFEARALSHLLERYGFKIMTRFRDVRYLHLEKIATLMRWKWLLNLARLVRLERLNIPMWAYPSWITVAEKVRT